MKILRKTGYFFCGLTPLLSCFLLQLFTLFPAIALFLFYLCLSWFPTFNLIDFIENYSYYVSDSGFTDFYQLLYAVFACLIFSGWFFLQFSKDPHVTLKKNPAIGRMGILLFSIVLLTIGFQYLSNFITSIIAGIWPWIYQDYAQLLEDAGFNNPGVLSYIYGIIIGPIAEEFIFRGVTLHYFKRAFPFWLANILQALLFGIYHMNLMQGIYTFCIGILFGLLFYYGKNLFFTITAHIIYNLFGFTGIIYSDSAFFQYCWIILMALCIGLGFGIYIRETKKLC